MGTWKKTVHFNRVVISLIGRPFSCRCLVGVEEQPRGMEGKGALFIELEGVMTGEYRKLYV